MTLKTIYQFSHPIKTNGKVKNLPLGRIWFNLLLPDDYPLIDEQVNKKKLNSIIKDIVEKYPPEEVAKTLSNIQRESFKLSSIVPISLSADSFVLPDDLEKEREKLKEIDDPLEFQEKAYKLAEKYYNYLREHDKKLFAIVDSGAKSSIKDLANLVIGRGPVMGIDGTVSKPIKSSLNDGLNVEEYYTAAKEARKTLFIRAKGTAEPGYLARKVIFANSNTVLGSQNCGTRKTLKLNVLDTMAPRLIGRYYVNSKGNLELITNDNYKGLIGKTIELRSPLYCVEKDNRICETCYGKIKDTANKHVGILAGSIINAIGVEGYAMKSRHKATQVDFRKPNFPEDMIDTGNMDFIKKFLIVKPDKIITKVPCHVEINKKEYREDEIVETGDYIMIPGIFDIYVEGVETPLTLFFPYNIKINKTDDIDSIGSIIKISYTPDSENNSVVCFQDLIDVSTNITLLVRLLEGRLKYIKDPLILLYSLHTQIPNVDLVHLEVIISNMFRCADDIRVKCRYKGSYKNSVILGQAEQPFVDSWYSTMAFEKIDKAIQNALIREVPTEMNPLEKVMLNEYEQL